MVLTYSDLRQWRDICEFLDGEDYKFADIEECDRYPYLYSSGRDIRRQLWSNYMIQFVRWCDPPYHLRRVKGWQLVIGWENKIDFLEQVVLFGRSPDDLPQLWRVEIWSRLVTRLEAEAQQDYLRQLESQRRRERLEQKQKAIEEGDCPALFGCFAMCGVSKAIDCPNYEVCRKFVPHF